MQTINRRQMLSATAKGAVAATVLGSVVGIEGCNAQQWIATALADLPTILQIVTSILSIVSASKGTIDAGLLTEVNQYGAEVKKDLQLAQTLITSYQTAGATARAGLLGQIDAALNTATGNLNSILTAFHVSDPTLEATISASLGAAITMVLAVQSLMPPPPAAAAVRLSLHNATDQSAAMKQAFNLIVQRNYPSAVIR